MATHAELQAAELTGRLWAAICEAGGTRPAMLEYRHFPRAYSAAWLAGLPLPVVENRPPGQPVALLDGSAEFERHRDHGLLWEAYARHPRTLVYENINRDMDGAWYTITARHLGRLAQCHLQVVCSVFQSSWGDDSLGPHWDTWYGAIVQTRGTKTWHIGESLLRETGPPVSKVTTHAGDILLIPKNLPHAVTTPEIPGYSTHLSFAIDRDNHAENPATTGKEKM